MLTRFQAQCHELQHQLHMSIEAERKAQNQIHQLQLMSKSQTAILRTNLNNKVGGRTGSWIEKKNCSTFPRIKSARENGR